MYALLPQEKSYSARISAWEVFEDLMLCYGKAVTITHKKSQQSRALGTHTCNPSYSEASPGKSS
jgi:hypothetical protein